MKVAFQQRNPSEWLVRDFGESMLVTDETEGCLQQKNPVKLTLPHSAAVVDFDGDCMADLFLTVVDTTSGKSYYEIYVRRESELIGAQSDDDGSLFANSTFGMNSLCLVAREELPSQSNNLFAFADIDRDSMIDMLFITRHDLSLHLYFNKLPNQQVV